MLVEPPPTRWGMPDPRDAEEDGFVAIGADLEPGTVLAAYRTGVFPMPVAGVDGMVWWSPPRRGILELGALHVSRSLQRSVRAVRTTCDQAFAEVVEACADPGRPHGWIDDGIRDAYLELHRLGWAHSIEVWDRQDALVGGLYGVAIGGLFAGESMFHRSRDASKVALVALVDHLRAAGDLGRRLLDVQWLTPHLASLGAVEIPQEQYLERLAIALRAQPAW